MQFLTQAHFLNLLTLNQVVQGLELGLSSYQVSAFVFPLCLIDVICKQKRIGELI